MLFSCNHNKLSVFAVPSFDNFFFFFVLSTALILIICFGGNFLNVPVSVRLLEISLLSSWISLFV